MKRKMPNTTPDPSLVVVIVGFLVALLTILKETSPAIIRWIKSRANASAQEAESKTVTTTKKTEIDVQAQLFLSDVGKSYFKQLEKRSENLQLKVSDYEKIVSDLREQLNKAFIEREEMRIKLASAQEEDSEGKMQIAQKTSEGVQLLEKIRQLESDLKDANSRNDKLQGNIEHLKQEVTKTEKERDDFKSDGEKINVQLEEANGRLDAAYSRFDQERSRAERLEKDNATLRKQIEEK